MGTASFYTYIYRDPSRNDEPIYIGKGVSRRGWTHLSRKDKHPFVQRLQFMKKNNIEPIIEIIYALNESHSFLLEGCLISIIGRKDLGNGPLLNLTNGGEGPSGTIRSEAWKLNLSNKLTGKPKSDNHKKNLKLTRNLRGPISEEQKLKISTPMKGRPKSEEFKNNLRGRKYPEKKLPIGKCPHCNVMSTLLILKRWHFDRCKSKGDLK